MVSNTSSINRLGTFRKNRLSGERGDVAVLTAIFVMVLLTLLPLVAYTSAIGQQPTVSFDQKYQGALGAAEAGVAAFVSDLNAGTVTTNSCTISSTSYSACATSGASPNYWVSLPTSSVSSYEYEAYANGPNGPFTIISTGKTTGPYGTVYRTVEETVNEQAIGGNFTAYFLFANDNSGNNQRNSAQAYLNGPMMIENGNYNGFNKCPTDLSTGNSTVLQSSNPNLIGTSVGSGGSVCTVVYGIPPNFPTSLSQTQLPSEASSGGCTYYGPTYIVFQPSGGYTVQSPETTPYSGCYPSGGSTITGANANGVIYVEQCPASPGKCAQTSSVNFSNSGGNFVYSGPGVAGSAVVEGSVDGKYTVAADNNIYISGPLCYGASTCTGASASTAGQVLGLVATDSILLGYQSANSSPPPGSMDENPNTTISRSDLLYGGPEYFAYDESQITGVAPLDAALMAMNGTFAYRGRNTGNDSNPLSFDGSVAVNVPCTADNVNNYVIGGHMCRTNWAFLEQSHGNGQSGNGPQFTYDGNLSSALPPFFPTSTGSSGAAAFAASGFVEVLNSYQPLPLS